MVSSEEVTDTISSGELQKKQSPDNGKHTIQKKDETQIYKSQNPEKSTPVKSEKSLQDPGAGVHISQLDKEGTVKSEKSLQDPGAGVNISQLDKEGSISSIASAKVSITTGTISSSLQSVQSGRSPIIREKVSEDGYHWRKYGQKLVKGNEFIRSYYRCTHPSCPVKKQLERSHDGKISDIVHFGHHDHPKPEFHPPQAVGMALAVVEEKAHEPLSIVKDEACSPHKLKPSSTSQISTVTSSEDVQPESNRIGDDVDDGDAVPLKRQKKDNRKIESSPADKLAAEPRIVVQTLSEVDIVNDGYRWRKYGQKMVKGNPNPRSYYRCSTPGCPVKKHVERASHDPKVVITSYEGQHDHNIPPSRTITQNPSGLNNGGSGSKPVAADDAVDKSMSPIGETQKEQQTQKEQVNSSASSMISKLEAGNTGKSSDAEGSNAKGSTGTVVDSSSVSRGISDEKNGNESRNEMKTNFTACSAQTITPGLESNPNEQHITSAEPVQS